MNAQYDFLATVFSIFFHSLLILVDSFTQLFSELSFMWYYSAQSTNCLTKTTEENNLVTSKVKFFPEKIVLRLLKIYCSVFEK